MTRSASSGTRRRAGVRCAIYTRKSAGAGPTAGLQFNSRLAQQEACEPFINSQRHEGWVCLRAACDARRSNATLVGSDEVPFAALAEREGVSPSYFTRLVR